MNNIVSTNTKGTLTGEVGAVGSGVSNPDSGEWSSATIAPPVERKVVAKGASASDGVISDPIDLLFKQIGSKSLLTASEEQKIARSLISARREFLESLFSCVPIAQEAINLARRVIEEGGYSNHRNILDIAANDEKSDIVQTVAKAKLNLDTAVAVLNRSESRWKECGGGDAGGELGESTLTAVRVDRAKVGRLLAEIPMRPAFIRDFRCEFERVASVVRGGSSASLAVTKELIRAQETREGLLRTSDRITEAYTVYIRAQETLVQRNIALVTHAAKMFSLGTLAREDFVQEGIIGLMTAAEKFDPERNIRFCTYATPWIRQALFRFVDTHGRTVRVPGGVQSAIRKVEDYRQLMRGSLGREATPEEIEKALKGKTPGVSVTEEWLSQVAPAGRTEVSLSGSYVYRPDGELVSGDTLACSGASPADTVLARDALEGVKGDVDEALSSVLNPQQRRVIQWRFGLRDGEAKTLKEIGDELGVSKERVRQIEKAALEKLRGSRLAQRYFG